MSTHARAEPGDQLDKILPGDGAAGDIFGFSVAYNGVLALIGAIQNELSGSVYIYDVASRELLSKMRADDGADGDFFGRAVAMDGAFAVVGSPRDSDFGTSTGSAYIFDLSDPSNPQQVVKLLSQDADRLDQIGSSVALSGSIAIVGVPGDDDGADGSGSAYLFDIHSGAQLAKLRANSPRQGAQFGTSVAIAGSFAVVGAPNANGSSNGAAYIFDITDPTRPVEIAKIVPATGPAGPFGNSVAMNTRRAVIGGRSDGVDVFDLGTTRQIAELIPANLVHSDQFGLSVGISRRNLVIAGAPSDDDNGIDSGSAFVFDISDPNNPIEITGLFAKDGTAGDRFGFSVAIWGLTAISGALQDDDNGDNSGSAYLFDAANCPADLDDDDDVDADDFFIFLDAFVTGDLGVCDIIGDGDCDAADFFAYLDLFADGCD